LATAASTAFATIDVVGDTSNSSGANPWDAKGNIYRVDQSVRLTQLESYLQFQGQQNIQYYVYDSPTDEGTYTRIHTNSVTHSGSGADWYPSGPLNVPLNAGRYYLLGFSFPSSVPPPVTYYFGVGEQEAVSFGAQIRAFAAGVHPPGTTVFPAGNDQAIYHQRITTGPIPEPATWLAAVAALVFAIGTSRRARVR
jgi:hypothetical protein